MAAGALAQELGTEGARVEVASAGTDPVRQGGGSSLRMTVSLQPEG